MGERKQLEKRVKILNRHITCLKIFVVAFCLATVLLNTYHIHRLKTSSHDLGYLMSYHSKTMKKLNIAKQVARNNGLATGSSIEGNGVSKKNFTVKTYFTENNRKRFDPLSKSTHEYLFRKHKELRNRIKDRLVLGHENFMLPFFNISNRGYVFQTHQIFSIKIIFLFI